MSERRDGMSAAGARAAGLLYLVIIACGIFSEAVVRTSLVVTDDASVTAGKILAAPSLFRAGFAADVLMLLSDVAIAVILYVILRPLGRPLALAAAAFRLIQAAIISVSLLGYYAAYLLLSGAAYATAIDAGAREALALLLLQLHGHGYDLALVFFAFSCFSIGLLVVRSPHLPRLIGYGLIAAGGVYLLGSATRFLVPHLLPYVAPAYVVPLCAELAFGLWLLFKAPRVDAVRA